MMLWARFRRKMRIPGPLWELTLLSGLACLGLGLAWVQDDSVFAAVFAAEAAFAAAEALYLSV
jgi:lipid-A-disaccharide synthase-like uncharacterized protein